MAPKRPSPLTDPPSVSSSSSEEEDISDKETDIEEEEQRESKLKSTDEKPTQSQSSFESDPNEESDIDSPTASGFTIKPIVSKPIDHLTFTESKPSSKKRQSETKKRRKISNGVSEQKRSGINRLWSDDDEIVILEGIIDFQVKENADPFGNMGEFHEFLKKSLRIDVSKSQLMSKIKRLKKKYRINAVKVENGDENVFLKSHDRRSFDVSKKIWGGKDSNSVIENGKSKKKSAIKNGNEIALEESFEELKCEMKTNDEDFWSLYPGIEKNFNVLMPTSLENFVKENMVLIGNSKAKELEKKWEKLRVREIELYLKRVKLIQEQTELVLAAMKSSNS